MLINKVRKVAPTLAGVARAKAIVLKGWSPYPDTRHVQMWIWRYPTLLDATNITNGVLIDTTSANKYRDENDDGSPLAVGQTAYYRIQSEDEWGNLSYLSAILPITFTGTNVGDLIGTIGSAQIADGAVTDVKISGQIGAHKTRLVGDGNLCRNPGLRGGLSDGWTLASQVFVKSRAAALVAGAPSEYVFEIVGNGTFSTSAFVGNPADKFEVSGGELFAGRFFAAASGIVGTGGIRLQTRFSNASGDGVYTYIPINTALPALSAAGVWQEVTGLIAVPANVNGLPTAMMEAYIEIQNTITAGRAYAAKPRLRRATTNDMLGPGAVADGNTDQTAPGTPTALTLTQTAKTTDAGDGRVEIGIKAAWTAPAAGVPVKRYMVEINDGVDTIYKYTKQPPYRFNGVVGTNYAVKVNAESFSGAAGPQTAAVNITPTGKVTAPGSPTAVTLVPKAKMMRIKGAAPADKDLAGYNYYFNTVNNAGSAVLLDFSDATKYDDTTERAGGTSCYYWMAAVNRSGVEGTRVPASNNPQLSRGASINDLAVGLPGNYLPNSDLSAALAGWGYEWSDDPSLFLFGLRTDTYAPHPGALQIYQKDGSAGHVYGAGPKNPDGSTMYFSVAAGEWYELSTYYLGHRCEGIRPYIRWERWNSTTGAWELSAHASPGIYPAYQATNPNKKLSEYVRTPFVKLQAPADAGRCTVFWRHAGTRQGFGFTDSYLWLHKMYFGVCGANQTEATPWSPTAPNLIGAGNTDATPLIAPTGLTLGQNYQLVDQGDGTVKTKYKATWNPLAGAVRFELQISQADTAGGTYTVISNIITTATLAEFDVTIGRFYKAALRAFSFNGTAGAQSGLIGPVQPLAAGTTLTTPAAPTVAQIANGYQYSWPVPTDKTYRETAVLVNGVELRRTSAGYLIDTTPREIGATPSITIRHYDRSGNATSASPATVAPAWRATKAAEIGTMEVKPSKLFRPGGTNRIRDYELEEPEATMHIYYALFTDLETFMPIPQGDGGAVPGWVKELNPPADLMGSSFNRIRFNGTGYPINARLYSETDRLSPVEEGLDYVFESSVKRAAHVDRFNLHIRFFTVVAGVVTFLQQYTNTTTAKVESPANGTAYRLFGAMKAPSGAVYASVRVEAIPATGQVAQFVAASPKIREMSVVGDNTFATLLNDTGSVTNGNSDFTVITGPATTMEQVPRVPRYAKIGFRARNNSGAVADMNFKLERFIPVSGLWQQIDATGTVRMSVNGGYSEVFLDNGAVQSFASFVGAMYRIRCTPSQGSNDLNSRRLWVEWVYG